MRSSVLFTAAFAAAVLATPILDAREEIVQTTEEVVYVTQVVTVTDLGDAAAPTKAAVPTAAQGYGRHPKHGKGRGRHRGKSSKAAPSSAAPVPSSEAPAPAPTSYEQPAPEPTTEAPAPAPTSYEEPAPAPTSYEQPAPAPSSSQAPPPPANTPPAGGVATTYEQAVVQHHNYHRANHSAIDIKWSASLASTALKIAKSCVYAHDRTVDGGGYGQNIAAGLKAGSVGSVITDMFYNGEVGAFGNQYGRSQVDENVFSKVGHMTQIVWKDTTEVGCATFDCSAVGLKNVNSDVPDHYTVCNYSPPGNYDGQYAEQVGASLQQPTVHGSYNVNTAEIQSNAQSIFQ